MVKWRVSKVIVHGGSIENIVSKTLVQTLGLSTIKHRKPYKIGWIKNKVEVKLHELFSVPFSIRKHYKEEAICDVIDIDACHILLGGPGNTMSMASIKVR